MACGPPTEIEWPGSGSAGFTRFRWALWNIGPVTTGPMFHRASGGRHGGGGSGAGGRGGRGRGPQVSPGSVGRYGGSGRLHRARCSIGPVGGDTAGADVARGTGAAVGLVLWDTAEPEPP